MNNERVKKYLSDHTLLKKHYKTEGKDIPSRIKGVPVDGDIKNTILRIIFFKDDDENIGISRDPTFITKLYQVFDADFNAKVSKDPPPPEESQKELLIKQIIDYHKMSYKEMKEKVCNTLECTTETQEVKKPGSVKETEVVGKDSFNEEKVVGKTKVEDERSQEEKKNKIIAALSEIGGVEGESKIIITYIGLINYLIKLVSTSDAETTIIEQIKEIDKNPVCLVKIATTVPNDKECTAGKGWPENLFEIQEFLIKKYSEKIDLESMKSDINNIENYRNEGIKYIDKVKRIVDYIKKGGENSEKNIIDIKEILGEDKLPRLEQIINLKGILFDDKKEELSRNYVSIKLGETIETDDKITTNIDYIIEDVLQAPKVFIVINDKPKGGFAKKTYDEPNKYMKYGYCINDNEGKVVKYDKQENPVDNKQFSRIFDNPFQEEGQELEDWKLSNKDISEKLAGGKDVVIFGFGASGSGKTYTLLEETKNNNSVTHLIKDAMGSNWGIIEDKYYVMDDKSRKTLQDDALRMADTVRAEIPELKCGWKKTDGRFIENITAGKAIAAVSGVEETKKALIGQFSFKSKAGEEKPIKELQINEINVTEMHKKLKECPDPEPKPLLVNGWDKDTEEAKPELGYYLDLVRWSPNNVASSRGPRVIKYGYKDKQDKPGKLIIVDMPGSESVTDIIKKTYEKLKLLKSNKFSVLSYKGLESEGLHTILKLPYIDKNNNNDYFFNKNEEVDQNAIENSINNLRNSLKKWGKEPPKAEAKEKLIIEYAINPGSKKIHEIIEEIFNINIYDKLYPNPATMRRVMTGVDGKGGVETDPMYELHYELKVFTVSFLYLIRTSYYVQIMLFHLRNLFLSKAGKDTDVNWMSEAGKLTNMVTELDTDGVTAENKAIRASGGFKGGDMEIPERDVEREGEFKSEEGAVIKKNGLKLLFDNIIRKEKGASDSSDPVMIVIGLINSNTKKDDSEHNKYIETMRYLSELNPSDAKCPQKELVILDKVDDGKSEWLMKKANAAKPAAMAAAAAVKEGGGGRKTRKKRDKRRKYTIIKRIKHKMKPNKRKTKQNNKYNSSKKCLKKKVFKTIRKR